MLFVAGQWKRKHTSVGRNRSNNTGAEDDSKSFQWILKETKITPCSPNCTPRSPPFLGPKRILHKRRLFLACAILIAATAIVYSVVGMKGMMEILTRLTSRSMIGRQNIRQLTLQFYNPGFFVTASTIPSTVSRFHQHLAGCGYYYEICGTTIERTDRKKVKRLFDIEKVRGGSQHDYSKQSRKNERSYHGYGDRKNNPEKETKIETSNKRREGKLNNPLLHLIQSRNRASKVMRQGTGAIFSVFGFLGSSFVSFATDRRSFEDRFVEPFRALNNFLKTSG